MKNTETAAIESTDITSNFLKGFDKIISKDDSRPALCHVFFDNGHAIATDAYAMVKVKLELYRVNGEDEHLLDGYFADKVILNEIKTKKNEYITLSKGAVNVYTKDRTKKLKTIQLLTSEDIGGVFPDYNAIIPQSTAEISTINFDANLLQNVQKIYQHATNLKPAEGLRIEFAGQNKGIVIKNKGDLFLGVIMPKIIK